MSIARTVLDCVRDKKLVAISVLRMPGCLCGVRSQLNLVGFCVLWLLSFHLYFCLAACLLSHTLKLLFRQNDHEECYAVVLLLLNHAFVFECFRLFFFFRKSPIDK